LEVRTSEKAYICPVVGCGKSFNQLMNLFQHIDKTYGHTITERFLVIDKVAGTIRVLTTRSAPEELKQPQEVAA